MSASVASIFGVQAGTRKHRGVVGLGVKGLRGLGRTV